MAFLNIRPFSALPKASNQGASWPNKKVKTESGPQGTPGKTSSVTPTPGHKHQALRARPNPDQVNIPKTALSQLTAEEIVNQLLFLSSTIINAVQIHTASVDNLNTAQVKDAIFAQIRDTLGSDVDLNTGLSTILAEIDQLPDFQPDATELFYALKIIYSDNGTPLSPSETERKVAQSMVSAYTSVWTEANASLSEMPEDLIRRHHLLEQNHNKAIEEIMQYSVEPDDIEAMAFHPVFEEIRASTDLLRDQRARLSKFTLKPVVDLIDQWRSGKTTVNEADITCHGSYADFKSSFLKKYNLKQKRLQDTINTTSQEMATIRNKLGLQANETLSDLTATRCEELTKGKLQPFRDATKQQLDDFGCKSFYVRHGLNGPVAAAQADSSNTHYQSILLERDQEKGYRVVVMDSLGSGKRTTSPYIAANDQETIDTILNHIGHLCYTSNTHNRIIDDGEIAQRILPTDIYLDAVEETPPSHYRQTGSQCGIQCVKNLIAEASGLEVSGAAMAIDPSAAGDEHSQPADPVGSVESAYFWDKLCPPSHDSHGERLKRTLDAVTSTDRATFDISKYSDLEAWVNGEASPGPLDDHLLDTFFADFTQLLQAQEDSKKPLSRTRLPSLFQAAKEKPAKKEFSIDDFDISCKTITTQSSSGHTERCEHEVSFFKDKPPPKDLVIHLPTRGQEPDADLYDIVNSLSNALDDLPEEQRPKHIHFSIGVNGSDEDQTTDNYQKAVILFEGLKSTNKNIELPISVKIFGFQWSVKGPEGSTPFIPFGEFRNYLFDETFVAENDHTLSDGCRYIQMDGDMTFTPDALRECLDLADGESTIMGFQAATSEPKYQATREAFVLNERIQRAVGDDAYFSEKMQLHSAQSMRELMGLRRKGTEINGKSDCEGFYIDINLQNSGCRFKAMPKGQSVGLHNFKNKYSVRNRPPITTRDQFIDWLSSLAGQRESMARSDFFTHQLARKYVTSDIPIIKAQKNLYLPTLMRHGHSLSSSENILSALENNTFEGLTEAQKAICDQFLADVENIGHPQRQKIKQRILAQAREVLNFTKEKAGALEDNDLKHQLQKRSICFTDNASGAEPTASLVDDADVWDLTDEPNQSREPESVPYDRKNTMPRMRFPKNKQQEEIKKNSIVVPSLQAAEKDPTLHAFVQLYKKVSEKIQSNQELANRHPEFTQSMISKHIITQSSSKKQKRDMQQTTAPRKQNTRKIEATSGTDAREKAWDNMLKLLVDLKNKHGGFDSIDLKQHPKLKRWINRIRTNYSQGKNLSEIQIQQLNTIGFQWDHHQAQWEGMFSKFLDHREHQEFSSKQVKQQLLQWIRTQRDLHSAGRLDPNRKERLNQINFDWSGEEVRRTKKLKSLEKPEGFDDLARTDAKRRRLIKQARRAAKSLGVEPPEWTDNIKRTTCLVPPPGYDSMDSKKQGTLRAHARNRARKEGIPTPDWAIQKQIIRDNVLEPPEGYEHMNPQRQSIARTTARNSAIHQGIRVPDWAVTKKRSSALEQPTNYNALNPHQKIGARFRSRKIAEREGKEVAAWAEAKQRASALDKPNNYDELSNTAQANARKRSREASKRFGLPVQKWAALRKN